MLLIKNGRVIDPASNIDGIMNILIKDDKIEALYKTGGITGDNIDVIDAAGKIVAPGLIDCHVHFREPGFEYKETIETGAKAAARGGFTSVICEPNTNPPMDTPEMVAKFESIVRDKGIVNIYTKACMTQGSSGKEVTDVKSLSEMKCVVAMSDDGHPVTDDNVCEKAFVSAKEFDMPVSPHCEDSSQSLNRAETNPRFSNPPFTNEALFIARDIEYAEKTGARLHISHISLKESVDLIKKAKERNLTEITCEVSPHHLLLDNDFVDADGIKPVVNPPVRSKEDVLSLRTALVEGVIDVIASDHAPHSAQDKKDGACGVIGLETSIGIIFSELVDKEILKINDVIKKMSYTPALIFGINAGRIAVGMPADITIIDPDKEWIVDVKEFESKSANCPFRGMRLKGVACCTIVNGRIVMKDGKLC